LLANGGITIVPGNQRAHRLWQLCGGLALCLTVLLALTPLAQLIPTAALQAAAALAVGSYASDGDAPRGVEFALAAPGDQSNAGIPSPIATSRGRADGSGPEGRAAAALCQHRSIRAREGAAGEHYRHQVSPQLRRDGTHPDRPTGLTIRI
jgi:hypothetical protein